MAYIPSCVSCEFIADLPLFSRGKVRDIYSIPSHPRNLLVIASNRISVFDNVLPCLIPQKGEILNALNVFWRKKLDEWGFAHDLVSYGSSIEEFLPEHLKGNPELHKRAAIIEKLSMYELEAIVRGFLTGTGFAAYQTTNPHAVCGHYLPEGVSDGSRLPYPLFTPTTKAQEGHDEHVSVEWIAARYGFAPERLSLQLYETMAYFARTKGILIADTKLEFGYARGKLKFGDEIGTPDSSRYWDAEDWVRAQEQGRSPQSLDKQFVREHAKKLGIDKRDPTAPDDRKFVDACAIDQEIIRRTRQIYRHIFWRLTSKKLELFQRKDMEIDIVPPRVRLDIILGSRTDLGQATPALKKVNELRIAGLVEPRLHIISCHRNPDALRQYAETIKNTDVDVIVAGAGKAAALPGMLKSWLRHFEKNDIPVIGVAFENTQLSTWAAHLSIEELPEQPVILDEDGRAYRGEGGCLQACERAVLGEFLPEHNWKASVEPEYNVPVWK